MADRRMEAHGEAALQARVGNKLQPSSLMRMGTHPGVRGRAEDGGMGIGIGTQSTRGGGAIPRTEPGRVEGRSGGSQRRRGVPRKALSAIGSGQLFQSIVETVVSDHDVRLIADRGILSVRFPERRNSRDRILDPVSCVRVKLCHPFTDRGSQCSQIFEFLRKTI
jgi:hypothetical protein